MARKRFISSSLRIHVEREETLGLLFSSVPSIVELRQRVVTFPSLIPLSFFLFFLNYLFISSSYQHFITSFLIFYSGVWRNINFVVAIIHVDCFLSFRCVISLALSVFPSISSFFFFFFNLGACSGVRLWWVRFLHFTCWWIAWICLAYLICYDWWRNWSRKNVAI